MAKQVFIRFTLWIVATLVVAVVGLGVSGAQAHPCDEHSQRAAISVSAPRSFEKTAIPQAAPSIKSQPRHQFASNPGAGAFPRPCLGDSRACDCCAGAGCGSVVFLSAVPHPFKRADADFTRLSIPRGRSPSGIDPASLLRPPKTFA
jgi:hypothetical protein